MSVPNLDRLSMDELRSFCAFGNETRSLVELADKLFPHRPKNHFKITRQLLSYARWRLSVREQMELGNYQAAEAFEDCCDTMLKLLPLWARWEET